MYIADIVTESGGLILSVCVSDSMVPLLSTILPSMVT